MNFLAGVKHIKKYDIDKNPSKLNLDLNEFDDEHNPYFNKTLIDQINLLNITKYNFKNDIHTELLGRIANYNNIHTNNILLTNGCDAAIKLIIDTLDTTKVYIHTPTYRQYERFSTIRGFEIILIPEDNFMNFIPDNKSIVFICTPGQPSGIIHHDIEKYIKLYPYVVFVIDETYIDYMILTGQTTSKSNLTLVYDNVVFVRSLSKAFGLAGLRIGYLVSASKNIELFEAAYNNKDLSCLIKSAGLSVFQNLNWYTDLAHKMFSSQNKIVNFLLHNQLPVHTTPCNFIVFNNPELHSFLAKHNIIVRDIGNNHSRLTIPSVKNCHILLQILAKFYLLKHLDIWVICLADRDDKYSYISQELSKHNFININWHRPTRDTRGGEFGCWESHKFCIKNSKSDKILIFEDDAKFTNSINNLDWSNLYNFILQSDESWDTFFFGGTIMSILMPAKNNTAIYNMKCNQTHAYIVKKHIADREDFDPNSHQGGVDDYYRRYTTQYGLIDPICIQKEGFATDNQWYSNNYFQNFFQHPNLYELFQIKSNLFSKYLRFLPTSIQPFFNPIPCMILINAGLQSFLNLFR